MGQGPRASLFRWYSTVFSRHSTHTHSHTHVHSHTHLKTHTLPGTLPKFQPQTVCLSKCPELSPPILLCPWRCGALISCSSPDPWTRGWIAPACPRLYVQAPHLSLGPDSRPETWDPLTARPPASIHATGPECTCGGGALTWPRAHLTQDPQAPLRPGPALYPCLPLTLLFWGAFGTEQIEDILNPLMHPKVQPPNLAPQWSRHSGPGQVPAMTSRHRESPGRTQSYPAACPRLPLCPEHPAPGQHEGTPGP